MSFLQEVRAKRKPFAEFLLDDEHSGVRELLEDMYPDSAHFIFELLQNAEDVNATEASFELQPDRLYFRHNGRAFSENDVWSITNIGKGTKKEHADKIGRFGIGFKSVFAFTGTPFVWSPTYSFKISGLVLPEEIEAKPTLKGNTLFEFPFNNPKRDPDSAYEEIRAGLEELSENTLLFLSNLESISWQVSNFNSMCCVVLRVQHSEHHFEILKQTEEKTTEACHFLKFMDTVEGLSGQSVAVSYILDFHPGIEQFNFKKPLSQQFRIAAATPGRVAVFFPADKETSGLRFHLHAPFVPDLTRASIKETTTNVPLFEHLADLTATSLHHIRDLGMLTANFLGILPNQHDHLFTNYTGIRSAIIEEMNCQALTPLYGGGHGPAKSLLQARASLKSLLSADDLRVFHGEDVQWVISATQRNSNVDRFLDQIATSRWDTDDFLNELDGHMDWLRGKSVAWHQRLYAFLYREIELQRVSGISRMPIVRLENGDYAAGDSCYFPNEGIAHLELTLHVDAGVYTSGNSKTQQLQARKFLENMGVRELGERESIKAILEQRYTREAELPNEKTYKSDLKRFVAFAESDAKAASLFECYYVLETEDGRMKPGNVFLDSPYVETGLTAYFSALGGDQKSPLSSEGYRDRGFADKRIISFASSIGVQTKLTIETAHCCNNPHWGSLRMSGTERLTKKAINRDFKIEGLDTVLERPTLELSRLIWLMMVKLADDKQYLKAKYRRNAKSGSRYVDSQLVHTLKKREWIPQRDGLFVRPALARHGCLPDGFPYDLGWEWLKAIEFGKKNRERSAERQQKKEAAKELGFKDDDTLERAKQFVTFPIEDQLRLLADFRARQELELPEQESSNSERRARRVSELAAEAPEKQTGVRNRSVPIGLREIKERAAEFLTQQYSDHEGQMICQVCMRPLPFKLDDGTHYFEKVEFLKELRKYYSQNHLALCPNHAAMFQHAHGSRELMKDTLLSLQGNKLAIVLAKKDAEIFLTRRHLGDLRTIIETESMDDEIIEDSDNSEKEPRDESASPQSLNQGLD